MKGDEIEPEERIVRIVVDIYLNKKPKGHAIMILSNFDFMKIEN